MCLFERPVPRQGRDGIEAPTDRLQPVEGRFCERDGGELSGSKERSDLGDSGVERFLRCHFAGRMGRKTNAGSAPIVTATLRSFSAVDRSCATDFSTLRRSAVEGWDGTGLFAEAGAPRKAFGRASAAGPDSNSRAAALRVIRVGIGPPNFARSLFHWRTSILRLRVKKVLYLHGFASSPGGRKVSALRDILGQRSFEIVAPDLNVPSFRRLDFDAMARLAQWEARRHEPSVIVGSSLGALVALEASVHGPRAPLVL